VKDRPEWLASSRIASAHQHHPAHGPGGAGNAGEQLGECRPAAAAVMAHAGEQIPDAQVTEASQRHVRLGKVALTLAALALDAQEPATERAQRSGQGLVTAGQ
jgi:hypothetical protein